MTILRRSLAVFYITVLLVFLAACSKTFTVKPVGHLGSKVEFYFYKSEKSDAPSEFAIVDVVVQKKVADKEWVVVWELKGKQVLEKIAYGQEYIGLDEVVSPKPLEKERQYRILVSESSFSGPNGFSGVEFSIDENGLVTEE